MDSRVGMLMPRLDERRWSCTHVKMRTMRAVQQDDAVMNRRPWWRNRFAYIVLVMIALVAALYLYRIGSDPPGLYADEASIGYNAWTIAHYGTDQYGIHFPLFFTDFGDYKGPIATYLVAPLTWVFAGGAAVVRLPSVLAGIALSVVAGRIALVRTGSRLVALVTIALTALQPWIFLQSHTMLEGNILMVLAVMCACWCIVEANIAGASGRWWTGAGVALAICIYTYSVGRLLALLIAAVAVLSFARVGREKMLRFLFPIAAAYIILAIWSFENPGALLARFQGVGLLADHPTVIAALARFLGNYGSYFSPGFLVLHGDGNLRQTTGFGGVLLDATIPLMIIGAARLVQSWRNPYSRFVVLGALVAPVPAALTLVAPHALRGAGLIPFLILMMVEGASWAGTLLQSRRLIAFGLVAVVIASAAPYFVDFFTGYPARAELEFEAGEGAAMAMAYTRAEAGGHRLFLSATLNQPALQLMYAVDAPPPQNDFVRRARIIVVRTLAQLDTAKPGDVLVIGPHDPPPPAARLLFLVDDGRIVQAPATVASSDLLCVYQA
jgi:4-amino-4-deoxy-L-arabinose transferase-like glycosyltransferase